MNMDKKSWTHLISSIFIIVICESIVVIQLNTIGTLAFVGYNIGLLLVYLLLRKELKWKYQQKV